MLTISNDLSGDGTVVLGLAGELTIETVGMLRDAIMTGFNEASHLKINCDQLSRIDFFGIQLICSAHRTSVVKKKLLTWDGSRSVNMAEVMSGTGFSRHCGCSLCPEHIDCMWT